VKNIAVIGSGISGLTSAYLLSKKHRVTVFEKNDYIGGHTATVQVEESGKTLNIDTGFIVFNDRTYPLFQKLMSEIGMGQQFTTMSFSVSNLQTRLEYNGHNLNTLFAQRKNIFRPSFWRLIREIMRFNELGQTLYNNGLEQSTETLGSFLSNEGFSRYFAEHYILPMGAAIWSASLKEMEAFELKFFIRFFQHHGLLDIRNRPQWYVIPGGSRQYISPLTLSFSDQIRLATKIKGINRQETGVTLHFHNEPDEHFDEVVFACHSDEAIGLLDDPTEAETDILNAIPYRANSVVLHTDTAMLPDKKRAWAAWNYQLNGDLERPASVTYNMNILQDLLVQKTYCVTLNQDAEIDQSKVLRTFTYHHPVFNRQSIAAQKRRDEICGLNHTHFTGAYWYNGFHEDGVRSAVDVAKRFDCLLQSTG
jgi:predicted NAD/FAD-binding protein